MIWASLNLVLGGCTDESQLTYITDQLQKNQAAIAQLQSKLAQDEQIINAQTQQTNQMQTYTQQIVTGVANQLAAQIASMQAQINALSK